MLSLFTVFLLSIIAFAGTEKTLSTRGHQTRITEELGDLAIHLAISQIRVATIEPATTWASQPGAVRTYDDSGSFSKGYKLYSDSAMTVSAETHIAGDPPPPDWNTGELRARYTDLNEPILRDGAWTFPIVDPRSMGEVDGFAYTLTPVGGSSPERTPALPMPVEWLYLLADGTIGSLGETGIFEGSHKATLGNPIIGRLAFWTDEETSKININTASEPTFWDRPRNAGREDRDFDAFPPANREYQRYPGHPATTALAPVLKPGDPLSPREKDQIYNLAPRVEPGGSNSGKISYLTDPKVSPNVITDGNRLFTTLDEFLFPPGRDRTGSAQETLVDPASLVRWRFFFTAESNAPEVTLFGTPRIALWPVATEVWYNDTSFQTGHERMIASCASLGTWNPGRDFSLDPELDQLDDYFFRTLAGDAAAGDSRVLRNLQLRSYLFDPSSRPIPGFGGNFLSKYGVETGLLQAAICDLILSKRSYFYVHMGDTAGGPTYFSPNRQVSSPIMLGGLPQQI